MEIELIFFSVHIPLIYEHLLHGYFVRWYVGQAKLNFNFLFYLKIKCNKVNEILDNSRLGIYRLSN